MWSYTYYEDNKHSGWNIIQNILQQASTIYSEIQDIKYASTYQLAAE